MKEMETGWAKREWELLDLNLAEPTWRTEEKPDPRVSVCTFPSAFRAFSIAFTQLKIAIPLLSDRFLSYHIAALLSSILAAHSYFKNGDMSSQNSVKVSKSSRERPL